MRLLGERFEKAQDEEKRFNILTIVAEKSANLLK
jgi:hypothetical protein